MPLVAVVAERIQVLQIEFRGRHCAVPEVPALQYAPVALSAENTERSTQPCYLRYQRFEFKLDCPLGITARPVAVR